MLGRVTLLRYRDLCIQHVVKYPWSVVLKCTALISGFGLPNPLILICGLLVRHSSTVYKLYTEGIQAMEGN